MLDFAHTPKPRPSKMKPLFTVTIIAWDLTISHPVLIYELTLYPYLRLDTCRNCNMVFVGTEIIRL